MSEEEMNNGPEEEHEEMEGSEEPMPEKGAGEPEMDMGGEEVTSDDKLMSALGYPIPLIPIFMLLSEDKKDRPFIRYHAIQSLVLNVVVWVLITILTVVTFGIGAICAWILWLVVLWPAYDSFNGNYTNLPVLTDFIKGQGWI